jgi:hypothetical protein
MREENADRGMWQTAVLAAVQPNEGGPTDDKVSEQLSTAGVQVHITPRTNRLWVA